MKRVWIKPDGRKWIREGKKTTTFRKNRHQGTYEIVEGSWYKAVSVGMILKLSPLCRISKTELINDHFLSEGDFKTPKDFSNWLKVNKLNLPDFGWLHRIEKIENYES